MKDKRHVKGFNEHKENINHITHASHSLYGEIRIGDTIEWSGDYFDGYNDDRTHKLKHLEGVNKIVDIFIQYNELKMRLDNRKIFSIKNIRTGEEWDNNWKKL